MTRPEKIKFDPRPTTELEISESRKQQFLSVLRTTLPKATLHISFSLPYCEDIPPCLKDKAQEVNSCRDKSNGNGLFTSMLLLNYSQIPDWKRQLGINQILKFGGCRENNRLLLQNFTKLMKMPV